MLAVLSSGTGCPAARDAAIFAAPAGSTPITFTDGFVSLIAAATPLSSPPPPTGTTTVPTSGTCSRISSAHVPCPAMTIGWSNGGTIVNPRAATSASARFRRSTDVVPSRITSPPNRLTPATLMAGAVVGITITAGAPRRWAASATAWP